MKASEEELRQAADWRAFRTGQELREKGAVLGVEETDDGWVGTMRDGERSRRVAVIWKSVRDVEVKCGCPERVKYGVFCAHGVATGLVLALGNREPREKLAPRATNSREISPDSSSGYRVIFAQNWRATLPNQRLGVRLVRGDSHHAELAQFLRDQGLKPGRVDFLLDLRASQVLGFFRALRGHSDVWLCDERACSVGGFGRVNAEGEIRGERLRMVVNREQIFRINGTNWTECSGDLLEVKEISASWCATWQRGEEVEIDFSDWLANEAEYSAAVQLHFENPPVLRKATLHKRLLWDVKNGQIGWKTEQFYEAGGERAEIADLPVFRKDSWWLADAVAEAKSLREGQRVLQGDRGIVRVERDQEEFVTRVFREIQRLGWRVFASKQAKIWRAERRVLTAKWVTSTRENGEIELSVRYEGEAGEVFSREEIQGMLRGSGRSRVLVDREEEVAVSGLLDDLPGQMIGGVWVGAPAAAEVVAAFYGKQAQPSREFSWPSEVGDAIREKFRGYQREGVAWILSRWNAFGGALLADDMGLGKTWQSIVAAEAHLQNSPGRSLVLVPTSLLSNWAAEWRQLAPNREIVLLHGSDRDARRESIGETALILTSFQTLTRDLAWHLQQRYELVIADEASLLRNPDTEISKAVAKIKSPCRLALTGTPVENRVRDLWSIFRWVQPGWLGTRQEFAQRYEVDGADLSRLQCRLAPFFLRRVKEEVAKDLPAKWLIHEWCELSAEQKKMMRALEEESRKSLGENDESAGAARMKVLTALLRMRQASCDLALLKPELAGEKSLSLEQRSGKLHRLLELVDDALANGRKMLIFSQFREQLRLIEALLSERGIPSLRLDGQTQNRGEKVAQFQKPKGPPIFLISLKAGGYGLNLTEADVVVHFDPWWNPAAEAQATDRAHRIGQTKPVTVYRLISRGSVEEAVLVMQEQKRDAAAALVREDPIDWSLDDMRALLDLQE